MRRNLYILAQCTFLLFITLLVNGCSLHEEPEMTPEGEVGVDPTAVTLNLNLAMNLSLAERAPVTITRASETNYLRRFIVEAYLDRQVAVRQTVYEEDFNRASLSVSMKLHARNYRILVWSRLCECGDTGTGTCLRCQESGFYPSCRKVYRE